MNFDNIDEAFRGFQKGQFKKISRQMKSNDLESVEIVMSLHFHVFNFFEILTKIEEFGTPQRMLGSHFEDYLIKISI